MPLSLKCNEKILGSVTLFNFLSAGLHSDLPLLTIIGPHGKTTLIEIRSFLASIAANSHGTTLVHGPHGKDCKEPWNTRGFPAIRQKHVAFTIMFVFIFTMYSPEPRFGEWVSTPVSDVEIYRNLCIKLKKTKIKSDQSTLLVACSKAKLNESCYIKWLLCRPSFAY